MAATSAKLRLFYPGLYPQIDNDLSTYLSGEFKKLQEVIALSKQVVVLMDTTATNLKNAANDAAALAAGVPLQGLYHNAGAVRVRLV